MHCETLSFLPESSSWKNRLKSAISILSELWEKYLMHFCQSIIAIPLSRKPAGLSCRTENVLFLIWSSHQYSLTYIITFIWRSSLSKSFSIVKHISEFSCYFLYLFCLWISQVPYSHLIQTLQNYTSRATIYVYFIKILYRFLSKLPGGKNESKRYNTQFYRKDFLTWWKMKKHRPWTGTIMLHACSYSINIMFCDEILPLNLQWLLQFSLGNSNTTA